jgi:hypothetical protein
MSFRGSLFWLVFLVSLPVQAESAKTLSGRWSASTMRTNFTAEPWGAACGPKPSGTSEPGGIVSIVQQGKELTLSGLGRTFASSSCWEAISGGRTVSHSASNRGWSTVCQSAPGDPRRSAVTTTITATDDRITLSEVGQFEFVIGNDTCHAVMRRNRTYALVEREGETRPVPAAPAAAPPVEEEAVAEADQRANTNCAQPGPPSRIEVSPSRKLLRPGDEYAFRVRVLDKNACQLDRPVTWMALATNSGVELNPKGVIKVLPNAAEGATELTASIQGRSVKVTVDVVSEARYQELLAAGTFNAAGETQDKAVTTLVSSTLGTKTAVLENPAQRRRTIFVWTISTIAAVLAAAALWMAGSRRRTKRPAPAFDASSSDGPLPPAEAERNPGVSQAVLVCPTCHEEYPLDQKYCALDGNRLMGLPPQLRLGGMSGGVCPVCRHGFDPGVTRCPDHDEELVPRPALGPSTPAAAMTRRICPLCGAIYGTDGQFCGNDGATLVPIN